MGCLAIHQAWCAGAGASGKKAANGCWRLPSRRPRPKAAGAIKRGRLEHVVLDTTVQLTRLHTQTDSRLLNQAREQPVDAGRHQTVMHDLPDLSGHQVYACGAPVMVDAAQRDLVQRCGLPAAEFFADAFTTAADTVAASAQEDAAAG
jgi:hypothetical protein